MYNSKSEIVSSSGPVNAAKGDLADASLFPKDEAPGMHPPCLPAAPGLGQTGASGHLVGVAIPLPDHGAL
eukprot:8911391-Pyramimonas_sp.AAC.1